MNTMTQTMTDNPLLRAKSLTLYKPGLGVLLLAVVVMLSALAVVYVADLNRRLFIEWQDTQGAQEALRIEWGKLLLEESTWSTQGRIGEIAKNNLGMQLPTANQVSIIKANL